VSKRTAFFTGSGAIVLAAIFLAFGGMDIANSQWDANIGDLDQVMGEDEAPVTLIEYASFTCGHCARFHTETLPELKEEYIDTGAARLVFRDFPLDGLALRASMLAHCAAPEQYYTLVDVLFATQQQWVSSPNPMQALANIGRQAGIGEADFEACMENEQLADRILRRAREAEEQYGVESTPSFVINGELMIGNQPIERFETAIERFVDG
jgi:protein-disulfide isomerase